MKKRLDVGREDLDESVDAAAFKEFCALAEEADTRLWYLNSLRALMATPVPTARRLR